MKTLHLYLLRQVVATLLMTVATFTFVLLLGNVLREILALLVNRQATLTVVLQAIALLIPFVLVFALPMGMLTATLLAFGRFSADSELTAARASGVSLLSLAGPVLLLSVVLSLLCGWFTMVLAPQCRVMYKELLFRQGMERATGLLSENQFIKDYPGLVIYIGKAEGDLLRDLTIYRYTKPEGLEGETNPASAPRLSEICMAESAKVWINPTNQQVTLNFPVAEVVHVAGWQPVTIENYPLTLPVTATSPSKRSSKLSEMSFKELLGVLYEGRSLGMDTTPVEVQLHRQVAFSFACIGFTLIGIPLGIQAHRRETSAGIGLALVLVLVYYSFIVLGQSWETRPELHPQMVVWIPNFLYQGVGAFLLWRVNRRR